MHYSISSVGSSPFSHEEFFYEGFFWTISFESLSWVAWTASHTLPANVLQLRFLSNSEQCHAYCTIESHPHPRLIEWLSAIPGRLWESILFSHKIEFIIIDEILLGRMTYIPSLDEDVSDVAGRLRLCFPSLILPEWMAIGESTVNSQNDNGIFCNKTKTIYASNFPPHTHFSQLVAW